jgi:hypothetical protein
MKPKILLLITAACLSLALLLNAYLARAQTSTTYDLSWNVIGAGGGHATSATYTLDATIGQPVTDISASTSVSLQSGFWVKFELLRVFLQLILRNH